MPASSKRLKYSAISQNRKLAYSETDRAYIGLEDIESWTGRLLPGERAEPEGTVSIYEVGDVLFGKLRPYLAKVHLAEEAGACSTEALVLRPQRSLHPAYLKYVLLDPKRIDEINASTFGAQMPRASWDFIGNCKIFVPELTTQKAIAAFLDRRINHGRRIRTDSFVGFAMLWFIGGLRRWRRGMLRHRVEKAHLERWYDLALGQARENYALGTEVLNCRRLIKGYSDTHVRAQSKFDRVLSALPMLKGRDDAADWIRRLREAALKDEKGDMLDGALKTVATLGHGPA